jgi:hypothetical protein
VWYGVVWYGTVSVVWYDMIYCVIWYTIGIWYTMWYGTLWYGTLCGMVHCVVWPLWHTVWYGTLGGMVYCVVWYVIVTYAMIYSHFRSKFIRGPQFNLVL